MNNLQEKHIKSDYPLVKNFIKIDLKRLLMSYLRQKNKTMKSLLMCGFTSLHILKTEYLNQLYAEILTVIYQFVRDDYAILFHTQNYNNHPGMSVVNQVLISYSYAT